MEIAVIGAGISGLSFAHFVTRLDPEAKITIFEKSNRTGGHIRSVNSDGVLLEKGPRTLRGISDGSVMLVDFLLASGRNAEIFTISRSSPANRKYLLDVDETLVEVPTRLSPRVWYNFFFNNKLTRGWFLTTLRELFTDSSSSGNSDTSGTNGTNGGSGSDYSVETLLNRRFGKNNFVVRIASAVLHGVYAGDISKLSAKSLMTRMFDIDQAGQSLVATALKNVLHKLKSLFKSVLSIFGLAGAKATETESQSSSASLLDVYGATIAHNDVHALQNTLKKSPMITFKNGLQSATDALRDSLVNKVTFVYDCDVKRIENCGDRVSVVYCHNNGGKESVKTFDRVNSTLATCELTKLVNDAELAHLLAQPEYASVGLMNVYVPGKNLLPEPGFGYLIPKVSSQSEKVLGVIFDSSIEQHRTQFETQNLESNAAAKSDYTKLTVMMGGHYWAPDSVPESRECIQNGKNVLQRHLGIDYDAWVSQAKAENWHELPQLSYTLIQNGIPQYNVGFSDVKDQIVARCDEVYGRNLILSGMCFNGGIGVPDCVSNAFKLAVDLTKQSHEQQQQQ